MFEIFAPFIPKAAPIFVIVGVVALALVTFTNVDATPLACPAK